MTIYLSYIDRKTGLKEQNIEKNDIGFVNKSLDIRNCIFRTYILRQATKKLFVIILE